MTTAGPFAAIIVAAGRSRRMGSDKLWTDFWGRPTWRWSLDVVLASPGLQRVAITVPADAVDRFRAALPADAEERCLVVPGGEARADSVIAGLWALTGAGFDDTTIVLVHDAARPAFSDCRCNGGDYRALHGGRFCAADLVGRLRIYTSSISHETQLSGQL